MSPRYRSRVSNGQGNVHARDYSEATAEQIDQKVRNLLDDAYQLARTTLMADGDKLDVIAKALLDYESLDSLPNRRNRRARPPDKSTARRSSAARQENARRKSRLVHWVSLRAKRRF